MPHAPTDHRPTGAPLEGAEPDLLDRYRQAANYLSVGQIHLMGNPLLRRPLLPAHVEPRLLATGEPRRSGRPTWSRCT